jgi:hypothetical protein
VWSGAELAVRTGLLYSYSAPGALNYLQAEVTFVFFTARSSVQALYSAALLRRGRNYPMHLQGKDALRPGD